MRVPIPLLRVMYRCAYWLLRAYWFVRRPEVQGVKCVLTDGDQVLLVRHTYGHREWDLPGGAVKRDEPPLNAARREMHEELGIRIEDWISLGQMSADVDRRRDRLHCFQAELHEPRITVDPGELAAVSWFPRKALPSELGRYVDRILARVSG